MIHGRAIATNYTPTKHPVNAFKSAVQLAAREVYQGAPLQGPLSFKAVFVMPRPQKFSRKKDDPGRLWCPAKPDNDNLIKSVADALNSLCWNDDAQIARTVVSKFYAARDEQPCVEIEIEVIE